MPIPVSGQTVRRFNRSTPTIREVLYVRPDQLAAAVYLNQEFEMTEIVWRMTEPSKRKPEGDAFWAVAPRTPAKKPTKSQK